MEFFFTTYVDNTALFFAANIIYCLAYVVTSMVWLRVLTIVAAVCTFPYFFFQLEPLWSALLWQSAFLIINLVNLCVLLFRMRPVQLTDTEKSLHQSIFSGLQAHEMRKLLRFAETRVFDPGDHLLEGGTENSRLMLIVEGQCEVTKSNVVIGSISSQQFCGEMSFMSDQPTNATVKAATKVIVYQWEKSGLDRLFKSSGLYSNYLLGLLNKQIAQRLREVNGKLAIAA